MLSDVRMHTGRPPRGRRGSVFVKEFCESYVSICKIISPSALLMCPPPLSLQLNNSSKVLSSLSFTTSVDMLVEAFMSPCLLSPLAIDCTDSSDLQFSSCLDWRLRRSRRLQGRWRSCWCRYCDRSALTNRHSIGYSVDLCSHVELFRGFPVDWQVVNPLKNCREGLLSTWVVSFPGIVDGPFVKPCQRRLSRLYILN